MRWLVKICLPITLIANAATADEIDESARIMLAHMKAIEGSEELIGRAIDEDCEFRYHPHIRRMEQCAVDRKFYHYRMRRIFRESDLDNRIIIAMCMDRNKSLNDYEWDRVQRCYERLAAGLR